MMGDWVVNFSGEVFSMGNKEFFNSHVVMSSGYKA